MDSDTVWQHIDNERAGWPISSSRFLQRWRQPSLCEGGPYATSARTSRSLIHACATCCGPRSGPGSATTRWSRTAALRSPLTHEEIVATLRGFVGSRRRVAFITDLEPLIDILVHNQDICRPLGIDHPMPPDAAAAALNRVISTPRPSGDGSPRGHAHGRHGRRLGLRKRR